MRTLPLAIYTADECYPQVLYADVPLLAYWVVVGGHGHVCLYICVGVSKRHVSYVDLKCALLHPLSENDSGACIT
jgi:hypothetical protein